MIYLNMYMRAYPQFAKDKRLLDAIEALQRKPRAAGKPRTVRKTAQIYATHDRAPAKSNLLGGLARLLETLKELCAADVTMERMLAIRKELQQMEL